MTKKVMMMLMVVVYYGSVALAVKWCREYKWQKYSNGEAEAVRRSPNESKSNLSPYARVEK